jgi:hypothetical protein
MESSDSSRIVDAAKTWISTQTGMNQNDLHVFQFERKGSDYEVGVEGYLAGTMKKYIVTVNSSGTVIGHREAYPINRNRGDGTLITVAFVFSILSLVGFGIYFVVLLAVLFSAIPIVAILSLIPLVLFLVGLYCFFRINRIRNYYNAGKYQEAYDENTIGLGVLALIFNGVVTGVLLLVARSSMQPANQ